MVLTVGQAQTDWLDGYLITIQGDTIKGQVQLEKPVRQTYTLVFKAQGQSTEQQYLPQEVKAFGTYAKSGNLRYQSVPVPDEYVEEYVAEAVFAKQLLGGAIDLYVYYPKNQKPAFYAFKQDSGYHVNPKGTLRLEGAQGKSLEKDLAVLEFISYLKDCYDPAYALNYSYRISTFKRLAQVYNTCSNEQTYKVPRPGTLILPYAQVGYTAITGFVQNSFLYEDNSPLDFLRDSSRTYTASGSVGFGLGAEFKKKTIYSGTSFRTGVYLQQFDITSDDEEIIGNSTVLSVRGEIKRKINIGNWRPYAAIGVTAGAIMNRNNAYTYNGGAAPVNFAYTDNNLFLGLGVEAGVEKRISQRLSLAPALRYDYFQRTGGGGGVYRQTAFGPLVTLTYHW